WKSGNADQDEWGNKLVTDYTSSSFWTYLAERYFDGSFRYLVDWFAVPEPNSGSDDWLGWVDDLLRYDDGGIDEPLYLVFPDFIAHYAEWGEKKYPWIGGQEWLHQAFDRCEIVTLTPSEPVADLTFELEPLSARCVKVMVGGIAAGEAVSVEWMAYDRDTDRLDNLHVTASHLSSTLGGKSFDCYDEAQRQCPKALCVGKPFTGARGRTLASSDSGGVTESGGEFVKTWLGTEQVPDGEDGLVENTYFLVDAPVEPHDARHDVQQNPAKQPVRVQIGLERHEVTVTDGQKKMASASVNGTSGMGMVPMKGGNEEETGDPMQDLMGSIQSAMGAATSPEGMSKSLFLQNMPMGTVLPGGPGGECDGVCMVTVEQKEVRADGFGGNELATVRAITLSLERPIPYQGSGTYEAMVSACPEDCSSGVGIGEGEVTVVRFTDDILELDVSGSYCVMSGLTSLSCPDPETFHARVLKPFGWAYDGDQIFHSIDTPGMAEYREYLSKVLADQLPGTVAVWRKQEDGLPGEAPSSTGETGAAGGAAGGEGAAGAVTPTCDCSCDGYRALMAAVEAYQAELQAAAREGRPPPPSPPAVQSLMQCSMQCAQQWGACGNPGR
ncbi:MAG TPA: hypothetical protein VE173_13710, partial [Longimicrobiales bacterium]|nr:hypothetical protein [Longimicrobiales bacterium]